MSMLDHFQNLFRKKGEVNTLDDSVVFMEGPAASVLASPGLGETRVGGEDEALDLVSLPVLGSRPAAQHVRTLGAMLAAGLVVLGGVTVVTLGQTDKVSQQVAASGQALMQSQRLAKSVSQALVGSASSFTEVGDSSNVLGKTMRGLKVGDPDLSLDAVSGVFSAELDALTPLVERAEKNASVVLAQQKILLQVGDALRTINRQSSDLLEIAETVSSLKLQQNASAAEISASGQLVMLTQRIGKSANEFLTMEGVSPEAVFLLGKDLNTFKEIATGLLSGSSELRLSAASDPQVRERLEALLALYENTRTEAGAILGNLQGLVAAREAQSAIVGESEALRVGLEKLQSGLSAQTGLGGAQLIMLVGAALFALACAAGLARVQVKDSQQRQRAAESRRLQAVDLEQEAKRVNDANQAAILRLMNELQTVAEGDLTQEATVTEDITGAIADSVNYTVEELRSLVGNVQNTATRVAQTTTMVENTSTELLATSAEQLREIRETGQSVLDMAQRINHVSSQAQESALVAPPVPGGR